MNTILELFLIGCALLFFVFVIRLLLKNKIGEKNSVIWLGASLLIFLIAGNPALLDKTASWVGIDYPPSLLFLLSTLVLLLFSLYQTVQITKLSNKIKDISQYLALNHKEEQQHEKAKFNLVENGHE